MYARLQIALWSAAAVFGLAYSESEAAKVSAVKTTAAHANSMEHILADLHHAKHLLDHANHTYNGHRAKADHEIAKAIHILHPTHHKKSSTAKGTTTAKPAHHKGTHESAQASDAHLKHAEHLVKDAIHGLHKHHGDKAHHVSHLLHQAVHEIEQAIHTHHKHHAKK